MSQSNIIQPTEITDFANALFVKVSPEKIKFSSKVLVDEMHTAIIIKNGRLQETLTAGLHKLGASRDDFCEVLYFAKTSKFKMLWGTKEKLDMRDVVTKNRIKLGANGDIDFRITNERKMYLELGKGKNILNIEGLKDTMLSSLISYIEEAIDEYVKEHKLSYNNLEENKTKVAKAIRGFISTNIEKKFGVRVNSFNINGIIIERGGRGQEEKDLTALKNKQKEKEKEEEKKKQQAQLEEHQIKKQEAIKKAEQKLQEEQLEEEYEEEFEEEQAEEEGEMLLL